MVFVRPFRQRLIHTLKILAPQFEEELGRVLE